MKAYMPVYFYGQFKSLPDFETHESFHTQREAFENAERITDCLNCKYPELGGVCYYIQEVEI